MVVAIGHSAIEDHTQRDVIAVKGSGPTLGPRMGRAVLNSLRRNTFAAWTWMGLEMVDPLRAI
jgi:hypothetical protein